ncbi:hypothetical protein [Candidatus Nitrosocosmicus hydrocola]|uniref:hypothetical protein n=1 Tax=Candidatus Nitrosocosmicus hydrocola TaxID=1826872 RepID=UPI0011E599CB|nr:hypothetical protein [Candidatus Nitrosocosmicus hydrocola]
MQYLKNQNLLMIAMTALLSTILLSYASMNLAFAQNNDTRQQETTDYTGFHSNIEQIKGHVEMAAFNKYFNDQAMTLGHTLHPIEEVLTLVTIPLASSDSELNGTFYSNLFELSDLASQNSTLDEFENHSQSSFGLSDRVIATVIPANILSTTEHNVSVIKDLLTVSGSEYAEGVSNGTIIMELEYQDGSAFIDRAYSLFNDTQNLSNDTTVITQALTDFKNLTDSVNNLMDPAVINQLITKINNELPQGDDSNTTNVKTSEDYISNIRGLLSEVETAFEDNDKLKATELATTAYLDNFEFIEAPIGKDLSDRGESLLREKLREQINGNATLDEIKQNIADINVVLDEATTALSSSSQ